jgi:hypothetical protein
VSCLSVIRPPQLDLAEKGAQILAGSVEDSAFLSKALGGVRALYAMLPPDLKHVQDSYADAEKGMLAAVTRLRSQAG